MLALSLHSFLLSAILVGIIVRHRAAAGWAFVGYLSLGLVHKLEQLTVGPSGWGYWLAADIVQKALCLVVVVEVGLRMFHRGLPGGRMLMQRLMLAVLALGFCNALFTGRLIWLSIGDGELYDAVVAASSGLAATGLWLSTAVLALALWTRWPIDPYHRDMLLGLWAFRFGSSALPPARVWPVWLYSAILIVWCAAAWRAVGATSRSWPPGIRERVWPWQAA